MISKPRLGNMGGNIQRNGVLKSVEAVLKKLISAENVTKKVLAEKSTFITLVHGKCIL